jgi:hypothetical protein
MPRPITILTLANVPLYALGLALALHARADAATPACDPATSPTPCVVASPNLPPTISAGPAIETAQLDNGDTITAAAGDMIVIQRDPIHGSYTIGVARGRQ